MRRRLLLLKPSLYDLGEMGIFGRQVQEITKKSFVLHLITFFHCVMLMRLLKMSQKGAWSVIDSAPF